MAVAVQEMAARLGLVTGQGLATLIRDRFPRWVLLVCVGLVALANTFNIAADLASMGAAANVVVPLPSVLLTVVMAASMLALEIFLSYRRYARVLRFLALSLARVRARALRRERRLGCRRPGLPGPEPRRRKGRAGGADSRVRYDGVAVPLLLAGERGGRGGGRAGARPTCTGRSPTSTSPRCASTSPAG